MQQVEKFLNHLKKALKARSITYRQVAQALELSESSVKRLFSSGELSLERIELICREFDLSFIELCRLVGEEQDESIWRLSLEQEAVIAKDMRLLQVYSLLHHGKNVSYIQERFDITAPELLKLLLTLDNLKLIELHEKNRVKIVNPGPYRLNREGAVGERIFEQTKKSFLNTSFKGSDEHVRFSSLPKVPHLVAKLRAQIDQVIQDYANELKYIEIDEGLEELGVLMAFRPWQIEDFGGLAPKKKATQKSGL
jgi:transcriptional regulator with XRE-family HTH domain